MQTGCNVEVIDRRRRQPVFTNQQSSPSSPTMYKKLSYRRGNARRATLVNSCYVSRAMGVITVSNSKC